ncbi:hypothetical protein [uncultured Microbulbifer sp.]|uniref:hypothetical protein n=1 Tax=uncultured Microbulbifer sp. TaxID=348147 RepID=UPI002622FD8F|nr:hypothetical protein [uncultured Microbulbifer sp.]
MNDRSDIVIESISGLLVSHAWRGHGSAIFIEVGQLVKTKSQNNPQGQFSIMLDCGWRIEDLNKILCGSSNTSAEIEISISSLVGEKVLSIESVGALPEIVITFASGKRVLSFTSIVGQPEWAICTPNEGWISSDHGAIVRNQA